MTESLISVIIVTYNAAKTLRFAIDSVVSQNYQNIEMLIIDGGSKDGSVEIVKNYGSRIAYFVSEKDGGIYDAMNKGIVAAKGEWVFFLGADDILTTTDCIQDFFSQQEISNSDFLYGDVMLKSNKKILGGSRTYRELIDRNICHQAIFYKKTVFTIEGLYDLQYKILADYDMNLRVFRNEELIKKYLPIVISVFNNKGGASNITLDSKFFKNQMEYFIKSDKLRTGEPALQQ